MEQRVKDRRLTSNEQDSVDQMGLILERRGGIDRRLDMGGTYREPHDPNFPRCTCDECWAKMESDSKRKSGNR